MSRDSSMQPSVSWEGVGVEGCVWREALMFRRGHLVSSMKNESEGDQSGVCSLLCTWVCRFLQDAVPATGSRGHKFGPSAAFLPGLPLSG